MAGDWIKMRIDLPNDPAVIAMSTRLDVDEDLVVGKLHRLWSWADGQTTDGDVRGVSAAWVDRFTRLPGFAEALQAVGWLGINGEAVTFPSFSRHMGSGAKKRQLAQLRQLESRTRNASVTPDCDSSVGNCCLEKRREEITHTQGAEHRNGIPRNAEEAVEWASMQNVPPDFAREIFHQMEARDWVDGAGQLISGWRSYIAARHAKEIRGSAQRAGGSGASRGNVGAKPKSTWELTKQMEAKEARIKEIRDQASHDAMGPMLCAEEKAEMKRLRGEVKQLRERIAKG